MEEELNAQFRSPSLPTTQGPDELEAELKAALLDYCDYLASWSASCDQTALDAEQIASGNRLLYMYMDRSTAEWCVHKHCLVCNSSNFAARVTSLPPYLTSVTYDEVCSKLYAPGDGGSAIKYLESAWNAYFVASLPSNFFEKAGEFSVLTVGESLLAFDVFTRQRQAHDLGADCFKYDIVYIGKCLFSAPDVG